MMLSISIYRLWVLIAVTYLLSMDHSSRVEGLCNNGHHCNDGDVCLERGSGDWEGNVMVCSNGVWGAVCGEDWDMDDAKVTCRQLGYDTEKVDYYRRSNFGYRQLEIPTVLNNVQCAGNEDNLIECTVKLNLGSDVQYCDPGNMAGVFCGYGKACSNGEIRFTPYVFHLFSIYDDHSAYDIYGRGAGALEYCREGQWTYISSNNRYRWDVNEAKVACKQLGFMSNKVDIVYFRGHRYLSSISCSYMQCTGSENSLAECLKVSTECPDPYHSAKIRCYSYGSASEGCSQGDIRLYSAFNDTPATEGVLQICSGNNTWNSACSDSYVFLYRYIAKIACIQLGYRGALAIRYDGGIYYGYSEYNDPSLYSCDDASYTNLLQCKHKHYGLCDINSAMGLVCYTSADGAGRGCSQADVRLYREHYGFSNKGVLQICSEDNTWHSVCYDSYLSSPYIAKVACIQLGFRGALAVYSYSHIIFIGDLYFESYGNNDLFSYFCNDTSYTNLQQCKHTKSKNLNCDNIYDSMRLECYTTDVNECTDGSVRLVRTTDTGLSNRVDEGRVEYCYDNMWAPVCDLTSTTAILMCQKMDFDDFATYSVITDYYKRSGKKSSFDYIHCSASANQLSDCKVYFKKTESSLWLLTDTSCVQEYTLTCFTHEAPKEIVDVSAPIIIPFTAPIAISVLIFLVIVRYCAKAVRRNRQRDISQNPLVTIVSMSESEKKDMQKPENMW